MNSPRNQLRIIAAATGLALTVALLISPAYADGGGSGAAALGPFNLTDSHGLTISQYQLSIDQGGALSPLQIIFSSALSITWDLYRFWVGFIAYVVDWATSLTWVSWITGPMHAAEQSLHDQVLQPLGMTTLSQAGAMGLLLVLAGTGAAVHLFKGRTGRGLIEALSSGAAAALAVGLLSSPVLLFAGDSTDLATPLRVAQDIGVELSSAVTGGGVANGPLTSTPEVADGKGIGGAGTMITETFIRPVHQMFNYGVVLDVHDTKCVPAYDKTLKAGPYEDGADEARNAVGRCDKALGTYADDDSWTRLMGLAIYGFTAAVLGVLVLVFVVLLMMSVLTLTWASLKLLLHAPMAILPGSSRGPGLRDLVDIVTSLVFLVAHLLLLSVLIRLIRGVLTATTTVPLQVRFVGVDLLLLASVGLLVASYINQRRGAKSFTQRLRDRLQATVRKDRPSFAAKAGQWLAKPSYGATYGQMGGGLRRPGRGGGTGGGMRSLNRVTASNGFRIAAVAGRLGAGAVTGGTSMVLSTAVQTGRAAAVAGRRTARVGQSGFQASQAGYRGLQTGYRVHDGLRHGAQRATTGNEHVDRLLGHTGRAHNYVEDQSKKAAANAAARAVVAAGPRVRPVGDGRAPRDTVERAIQKGRTSRARQLRQPETPVHSVTPDRPFPVLLSPQAVRRFVSPPAAKSTHERPSPAVSAAGPRLRGRDFPPRTEPPSTSPSVTPRPAPPRRPKPGLPPTTGIRKP